MKNKKKIVFITVTIIMIPIVGFLGIYGRQVLNAKAKINTIINDADKLADEGKYTEAVSKLSYIEEQFRIESFGLGTVKNEINAKIAQYKAEYTDPEKIQANKQKEDEKKKQEEAEKLQKQAEQKLAEQQEEKRLASFKNKEPQIGMTATELMNCKWGNPRDINRTTTANSVNEQWCYSGNRYVYLENGIVTTIQD